MESYRLLTSRYVYVARSWQPAQAKEACGTGYLSASEEPTGTGARERPTGRGDTSARRGAMAACLPMTTFVCVRRGHQGYIYVLQDFAICMSMMTKCILVCTWWDYH